MGPREGGRRRGWAGLAGRVGRARALAVAVEAERIGTMLWLEHPGLADGSDVGGWERERE